MLDQLADYFRTRLAGYPTTLKEDESLVILYKMLSKINCSLPLITLFLQLADSNLNPKKQVATRLVSLEKKILHACLQATIDFIDKLPDITVSPCPAPYSPLLR